AGAAYLRRGAARMLEGLRRNDQGGSALHALRPVWLRALSTWHGANLWRLWHARHRAPRRPGAPRASCLDCRRSDDDGSVGEDGAVSFSPLVAACPRRCASSRQRRAVGTRRQGVLLFNRAALV